LQDEVNQKECEQDKVDRTKKGAEPDSTGKESILVSTIVAVHSLQIKFYTVSQKTGPLLFLL